MSNFRPQGLSFLPPVVKNLLIINGLCFLMNKVAEVRFGQDLNSMLGLYFPLSGSFHVYQILTHVFMHGSFTHLLFNMFSLWMFGSALENYWGAKRFITYYFVTAFGAAMLHSLVNLYQFNALTNGLEPEQVSEVMREGRGLLERGMNYTLPALGNLNLLINIPTVGASGAVFGLLLAFGMLFPNTELLLIFLPIPIKAKYFVMLYGALELYQGVANSPGDNVAHFAHLGGMLFGFILIKYWNKRNRNSFY